MHTHVQSLGHQNLKCSLHKLIDHMQLCREVSRLPHSCLDWERSAALANFIQLHHCFQQGNTNLQVSFTSELCLPSELHVYVQVSNEPHRIHMDHGWNSSPWFRPPIFDNQVALYPVEIANVQQCDHTGTWQLTATTCFPNGVSFERLFRFKYHVSYHVYPLPSYILLASAFRRLSHACDGPY